MRPTKKISLSNVPTSENAPVTPVTTNVRTKPRKTPLAVTIRQMANGLFGELVVPAVRSLVVEFVNRAVTDAVYGPQSSQVDRRATRYGRASYTPYHRGSSLRNDSRGLREAPRGSVRPQFDDILFDSRDEAEEVLGLMYQRILDYSRVTIGDLYALCGLSSNYTHEYYGWRSLAGTRVYSTPEGFVIGLPEPISLQ